MVRERWADVIPGWYEISSLGNVRSVLRTGKDGRTWKGCAIKPSVTKGYLYFIASVNGKSSMVFVHIAVARAFLGPRPKGLEVNHKNGNRMDCRPSNLEYATRKKNAEHAARLGLMPTKANGRWKRTWRPAIE